MAAVVKPLFIGQIAKSNKEKENEAVKKWVVEIEKERGRVETRLVPARNKCTAISNCKNEGDTVLSCVPYTGQNVKVRDKPASYSTVLEGKRKDTPQPARRYRTVR